MRTMKKMSFPEPARRDYALWVHSLSAKANMPRLNRFEQRYLFNATRFVLPHEWHRIDAQHIITMRNMFHKYC